MATKQTRRSISVRGTTYDHLRRYCGSNDRSMSDVVEELLGKLLSTSIKRPAAKPAAVVAPRQARAAAVPVPAPAAKPAATGKRAPLPGRPAPTPASQVHGTRRVEATKNDYRGIRF